MLIDWLLYAGQFVAAGALATVLEFGFHRSYEGAGYTILPVTWGIAQVGLLVLLRLHLAPLSGFDTQAGALAAWWITFWSFVASAIPVAIWQLAVHRRQIRAVFSRPPVL